MSAPSDRGGAAWVFAVLAALLVGAIWIVPYVPTHDGANHIASCVLANRLEDPGSSLHRFLEPNNPITTLGFFAVCSRLNRVFDWMVAYRITIVVEALVFALGYAYLARGVRAGSKVAALGFGLALSWAFYMGFFSFHLATGLSLWLLGYAVRRESFSAVQWALLAASLLALAAMHVFATALTGLVFVGIVIARAPQGSRAVRGLIAVAVGVPAGLFALASFGDFAGSGSYAGVGGPSAPVWHSLSERVVDLAETFAGGGALRAWGYAAGAVVAIALALVALNSDRTNRVEKWFGIYAALSLVVFFFSPFNLYRWVFFSPRPLLLGLPLAFLAVPRDRLPRFTSWGVAFASAASIAWSASYHLAMAERLEPALAGLTAVQRSGPRMPLVMSGVESEVAHVEPLLTLGHLYVVAQGGVDPHLWADTASLDLFLFKKPPRELFGPFPPRDPRGELACAGQRPECRPRPQLLEWYALWGRGYEDTILYADDEDVHEVFARRGYAEDFRAGPLALLRPQRCALELRIERGEAPAVLEEQLVIQVGRAPIEVPVHQDILDAGSELPETELVRELEGPDCGALWLFVGSGKPSAEQTLLRCEGAPPTGRVIVNASPERPLAIQCRLVKVPLSALMSPREP